MKIFIIGPVRNITIEEETLIRKYVYDLKNTSHKVHWSVEDVDQNDPTGCRICSDNRKGMEDSDEVHVWWNPESQGSIFDLGMAFAFNKIIVIVNTNYQGPTPISQIGFDKCRENLEIIKESAEIQFEWNPNSQESVFNLGMAFALRKKIAFVNKSSFEKTPTKSFTNVLFELDAE